MSDYPKVMHRGMEEVTVQTYAEQGDREAEGWVAGDGSRVTLMPVEAVTETPVEAPAEAPNEPPTFGAADEGTGEEPTEGPADDQTHVKRSRKKK